MKPALLDVNLLIALAWPSHVHHAAAHRWFHDHARHGWATCPLTQTAFVRISSNPSVIPEAVPPPEAGEMLARITALEHHRFWPDDLTWSDLDSRLAARMLGHRQVTDAYLLALAARHGGRLATLDRGLRALVAEGTSAEQAIEVVRV